MLLLLALLFAAGTQQLAPQPVLNVGFQFGSQPTSILGFYDSVFPLPFILVVNNVGAGNLPEGKLLFHVEPPSGQRYIVPYSVALPIIKPGTSFTQELTYNAIEPGLHRFIADTFDIPGRIIQIQGGLNVVYLQGPEILYGSLGAVGIGVVSIVVAWAALRQSASVAGRRRRR